MRIRKLSASAVIMTATVLMFTACGNKAEPVNTEPTETVSGVGTEESLSEPEESKEPTPSPTATPTAEPVEESVESKESEVDTSEVEESSVEESEPDLGYEIIPIDEVVMYATTNANIRAGAGTQYDIVGSLSYAQETTVNGKVEDGDKVWYVIKTDNSDDIQMVSGGLLSATKPVQQQPSSNNGNTGDSGTQQQQPDAGQQQQPPTNNGYDPNQGNGAPGTFGSIPVVPKNDGSGAGGTDINWQ